MKVETVTYTSDYTGELRYALRVDEVYPIALDYDNKRDLMTAWATLLWITDGMPSGWEDQSI